MRDVAPAAPAQRRRAAPPGSLCVWRGREPPRPRPGRHLPPTAPTEGAAHANQAVCTSFAQNRSECSGTYQAAGMLGHRSWGHPPAEGPGLQVPGAHRLVAARRRGFHAVRRQPNGRESQTKRQRRGREPACVFVLKLFLSPRSPGSHMLPPTSPESSHDTGPPSCDVANLP